MVLFLFTPFAESASHPLTKFFVSCMMVIVAFGFKRFRFFIQSLLAFYFVSFVIGGGMLGTYYFFEVSFVFQDSVILTNANGFGDPISWLFVLIGFPLTWFYSRHQFDQVEMTKIHYDQIVEVSIEISGKSIILKGLIDSGNQLYDPITKLPVMIVESEKMVQIIPQEIIDLVSDQDPLEKMHETDHCWMNRLRIIPYRGVGQDHQFLFAIKPDEVIIQHREGSINVKKVLIGLNNRTLSSDGNYACIVHPKMIQSGRTENVS